jgi:hypothetical protein
MIRNVLPLLRHLSYHFSYCGRGLIPWSLPSATWHLITSVGLVAWIRFFFVNNQVLITPLNQGDEDSELAPSTSQSGY